MLENFGDCTAFVKNHSEEYSNLGPSKDKGSWHLCSAGIFGIGNTNNVHESTFGQLKLDKEIFSYQTHRKFIEVGTQKVCNFFYRLNCRISIEGASGGSAQNIIGPGLFSLEDKFPRGYRIASPARQLHVATRDIIRPILINAFLLDPRLDLATVSIEQKENAHVMRKVAEIFAAHRRPCYFKDPDQLPDKVYIVNTLRFRGTSIDVEKASLDLYNAFFGNEEYFKEGGVEELKVVRDRYCCVIKFGPGERLAFPNMQFACLCACFQVHLRCPGVVLAADHENWYDYKLHEYLDQSFVKQLDTKPSAKGEGSELTQMKKEDKARILVGSKSLPLVHALVVGRIIDSGHVDRVKKVYKDVDQLRGILLSGEDRASTIIKNLYNPFRTKGAARRKDPRKDGDSYMVSKREEAVAIGIIMERLVGLYRLYSKNVDRLLEQVVVYPHLTKDDVIIHKVKTMVQVWWSTCLRFQACYKGIVADGNDRVNISFGFTWRPEVKIGYELDADGEYRRYQAYVECMDARDKARDEARALATREAVMRGTQTSTPILGETEGQEECRLGHPTSSLKAIGGSASSGSKRGPSNQETGSTNPAKRRRTTVAGDDKAPSEASVGCSAASVAGGSPSNNAKTKRPSRHQDETRPAKRVKTTGSVDVTDNSSALAKIHAPSSLTCGTLNGGVCPLCEDDIRETYCQLKDCAHPFCVPCGRRNLMMTGFPDPDTTTNDDTSTHPRDFHTFQFKRAGQCPLCRKLPTLTSKWEIIDASNKGPRMPRNNSKSDLHDSLVGHYAYGAENGTTYLHQGTVKNDTVWDSLMVFYRPHDWRGQMFSRISRNSHSKWKSSHMVFMKEILCADNLKRRKCGQCGKAPSERSWENLVILQGCKAKCPNRHICIHCAIVLDIKSLKDKAGNVSIDQYLQKNRSYKTKFNCCERRSLFRRLDQRNLRMREDKLGWSFRRVRTALLEIRNDPESYGLGEAGEDLLSHLEPCNFFNLTPPPDPTEVVEEPPPTQP